MFEIIFSSIWVLMVIIVYISIEVVAVKRNWPSTCGWARSLSNWLDLSNKNIAEPSAVENNSQQFDLNEARFNWFLDWYMREGKRAEIIPNGHIYLFTKEDVVNSIDAKLNDFKLEK